MEVDITQSYTFKLLLTFSVALFSLSPFYTHASPVVRVFTGKTGHAIPLDVELFFRTCDKEVSKILPRRKDASRSIDYSVIAIDKTRLKKGWKLSRTNFSKMRLYLSDDMSDFKNRNDLLAELAATIIMKKVRGKSDKGFQAIPKWIVYGVLAKIQRKMRKRRIPGMIVYPGIHSLILSGHPPDLMAVIDHPLATSDGPSFILYLEMSEITLNSVLRLPNGKRLLEDILNLSLKGVPSDLSFRTALADAVKATDTMEGPLDSGASVFTRWLRKTALRSTVNIFNPLDATSAEREFLKYRKVKYSTKPSITSSGLERPSEERCCMLNNLANEIPKMKNPKLILKIKQRDLALLMLMLPGELQEPLDKMRRALSLLFSNKNDEFKKRYTIAEAEFYDVLDKQQQIESFISKVERKHVPPAFLYAPQIREIERSAGVNRKLCPLLDAFVNTTEKNVNQ